MLRFSWIVFHLIFVILSPIVQRGGWLLLLSGFIASPSFAAVPLTGITKVVSGLYHTCALTSVGGMKCWGYNANGRLGNNSTTDSLTSISVNSLSTGVSGISGSAFHTCALMSTGDVKCVGGNTVGQLGNGTTTPSLTLVDVISGASAIASGYDQTCVVVSGGVKCWGSNQYGKLGDGTNTHRTTPVDVSGLLSGSGASDVSGGDAHSCAVVSGAVKCWGINGNGRLGDGTTTTSWTPVDVVGLTGVTAVAAGSGGAHTCAVVSGGVKCWGDNTYGQLGDNSTTQRLTPVDVNGLTSGVTAIATGQEHSCALTGAGGVKCWGRNNYGQLGDGTTTNSSVPVDVSGLTSGVSSITAGVLHTCAVLSGGVKCWGYNSNGRLGDNSTTNRSTPVDVLVNDTLPTATALTLTLDPSGTPTYHVGEVLKGGYTYTDAEDDAESGSTFQWYQATDGACTAGKTTIALATSATYTVVNADIGKYLCFGVIPKNVQATGTEFLVTTSTPINKVHQTITFSPAATGTVGGGTGTVNLTSVTSASSGLTTFTFGSTTPSLCTVSGSTVSYIAVGTCTLTADQAGNTTYEVAPQVTSGVSISPGNQTISFNATTGTVGSSATPATATSGLPVTLTTSSPASICTISGATVNYLAVGTCSLTADQPGNANYNSAVQVSGNISIVNPPPPPVPTYPVTHSTPASGQKIQFDTLVGQKQTQSIILKNFGSAALIFNSVNTPIAPFSYPKPLPFNFIPTGDPTGSAKTLELSCTPTEIGLQTMTLQISTNDPNLPTLSYSLECLGRLPVAASSVANHSPLNFGNTLINNTVSQSIHFSESGNTDLILTSATITGANATDFQITAPTTFPVTVADGATSSQIITVSCTPKTATPLTATLQITTNDPANATLNYPLQCGGLLSLTLNTSGQGTISGCGSSCVQHYQQDTVVNLSAVAATGWQFSGWSGCNGQVKMTGNLSCTALFKQPVVVPTLPETPPTNPTLPPTPPIDNPTPPTNPILPPTPPVVPTVPSSDNVMDNSITVIGLVPTVNGVVAGSMSNHDQTAINLTVPENTSVSGGTLVGIVTNYGLISNVTLAPNSTINGGTLSGFNLNHGTLNTVTVSPHSQIVGGNYAGAIHNDGILIEPIILPNATMINSGVVENPILLSDSHLTGGQIIGIIIALGGSYSEVQTPENVTVITRVQDIPPEIFSRFNAQTLQVLPPEIVSQVNPTQFKAIPVAALAGFTSENMGAISPQVVQSLDKERINALDVPAFKAMPTVGVAKLLTNFDTEQITPAEAEKLLPSQWQIDQQGNLTAPPGVRIALKTLALTDIPVNLQLPNMTDLNSSFALGGKGTHPIINQINQISGVQGFAVAQQKTGVVQAQTSQSTETAKQQFSFMIDPEHIFIVDNSALRGLQMNEQGQYIIVSEDGKHIPITPMTKDPEALLTILGKNGKVDIQNSGVVLLKFNQIKRSRDGEEVHRVCMFDPFIELAPEDICTPEGVCNWDQADMSMQPGMRSSRNVRAKAAAKIIYPDGSSQKLYPAVLSPDLLVEEAKKIKGVEKAIFRMDGTFAVTYQGTKLLLIPEFDTQVQPIPVGQKVEPSLTLQPDGRLLYQVPYLDQLFSTILSVTFAP